MIRIFKIIILLFVAACSLNSNSSLWTKHKKIKYEKSLVSREINSKKEILQKEINPNIKIKINYEKNKINLFLRIRIKSQDLNDYRSILNYFARIKL